MFYYEYIDANLSSLVNFEGKIAVYPCGVNGERTIKVLRERYALLPDYKIDNKRCLTEKEYISLNDFIDLYTEDTLIIITAEKEDLALKMEKEVLSFAKENSVISLRSNYKQYAANHIKRLKNLLDLENLLPNYNDSKSSDVTKRIKVRIVHSKFQTFNTIDSICKAVIEDSQMDLLVILGWDTRSECVNQVNQRGYRFVPWQQYNPDEDQPDILIVSQPYDYVTQIKNVHDYAKLVVVANVLLIRNTEHLNEFWDVQNRSFLRYRPDYFLCDSLLYHDIRGTSESCGKIIEMGNAKFDGIYDVLHSDNSIPYKWTKIADKKKILWTTDHGVWDTHCSHETFDLYAKTVIDFFANHSNMALIFRPHKDLFEELVNVGIWKKGDVESFVSYMNHSNNMVFDDNETYEIAYKFSDAIIADACCGITLSALPTLKPICVCYRSILDEPFHPELTSNYVNVYDENQLVSFLKDQENGIDRELSKRAEAAERLVKNFDGKNGFRIKEFVKEKFLKN